MPSQIGRSFVGSLSCQWAFLQTRFNCVPLHVHDDIQVDTPAGEPCSLVTAYPYNNVEISRLMFNFKFKPNAQERPVDSAPMIQSENITVTGGSMTYVGRDANTYNIQQHPSRY